MVVVDGEADIALYPYNPSAIAAWTFLVLWGIGALVHFILMFPYRCAFPTPMIIGCIGNLSPFSPHDRYNPNYKKKMNRG